WSRTSATSSPAFAISFNWKRKGRRRPLDFGGSVDGVLAAMAAVTLVTMRLQSGRLRLGDALGPNVPAIKAVAKLDTRTCRVRLAPRLLQRVAQRGHAQHSAAVGQHALTVELRAGVEDLHVVNRAGPRQPLDLEGLLELVG